MIQEIDIMYMFRELYIDPGTGGMLFTLLFGLFGVVVFAFRSLAMKMKFRTSTSRVSEVNKKKIPIAIFTDSKRYWNVFDGELETGAVGNDNLVIGHDVDSDGRSE